MSVCSGAYLLVKNWATMGHRGYGPSSASTTMQPVIAPVLTAPIGSRWLIESRADLRGFVFPSNGNGPYQALFFDTLE